MENSINSDIIRGHIDTIILNTLVTYDKYVNEICDDIINKSNGQYEIKQATLYSSLKRLESEKYITAYFQDVPDVGRRRYYHLTDLGRVYIRENLENWNYSRKIINQLLSATQDEQIKIMTEPAQIPSRLLPPKKEVISEEPVKTSISEENYNENEISEEEIFNYKQVLNELIDKQSTNSDENKKIETEKIQDKYTEYYADESFLSDGEDIKRAISNNKINLNELIKLSNDSGLKIRVSSKDKIKDVGNILTNKLSCVTAWLVYLILMTETLVVGFSVKNSANISDLAYILFAIICLAFPITETVLFAMKPKKSQPKLPDFKLVLTTSIIIVFNVALIFCAIALLGNFDLGVYRNLLLFVVFPITILCDVPLFYILKYRLVKTFKFYVK